ncbi:MAG TPA: hypothetical protein VEH84_17615 [Alphaproteobacteria bacterium]|nr:hypothetical protein [Alphaproteobacteria bacterium]
MAEAGALGRAALPAGLILAAAALWQLLAAAAALPAGWAAADPAAVPPPAADFGALPHGVRTLRAERLLAAAPPGAGEAGRPALDAALAELDAALARRPADPWGWALRAEALARRDGPTTEAATALAMSLRSGRSERNLALWQLDLALRLHGWAMTADLPLLWAQLREMAAREPDALAPWRDDPLAAPFLAEALSGAGLP